MSVRTECPACRSKMVGPLILSPTQVVDYFRCMVCRHLWNVPKGKDEPIHHVTPLYPKRKPHAS